MQTVNKQKTLFLFHCKVEYKNGVRIKMECRVKGELFTK